MTQEFELAKVSAPTVADSPAKPTIQILSDRIMALSGGLRDVSNAMAIGEPEEVGAALALLTAEVYYCAWAYGLTVFPAMVLDLLQKRTSKDNDTTEKPMESDS